MNSAEYTMDSATVEYNTGMLRKCFSEERRLTEGVAVLQQMEGVLIVESIL